jgi:DNA-binding transcriptional MocR family regulator
MLDVAFQPDRFAAEPIYRQLAGYLRELVAAGRLVPGEKLPASRELALSLGLSRNTVNQAYQRLIDGNVVVSHVGQGTFVASRGAAASRPEPAGCRFAWEGLVARRTRALEIPAPLLRPAPDPIRFEFRGGRVDPELLPLAELRRTYSRAISAHLPSLASSLDPFGWRPLRDEIARALLARGIRCDADDIAITSGAQHALEMVARTLLDPGDAVALEQPGYFGAALVFAAARAQPIGIEVDDEGLRTDQLARVLHRRRVKLVYATPSAQSPTGVALSDPRRDALLELADAHQIPVLEDDYDSEFRYDDPPLPALKTRDPAGQVIYIGTFSKALFPGLRLGYVVAARPLLTRMVLARFSADFGSDALAQAAVTELLATGALERHVRGLRKHYARRRDAMLEALAEHMPDGTRFHPPRGGHAVWVALPGDVDSDALADSMFAAGIAATRGDIAYLDGRGRECLPLSFVNHSPERIAEGIALIGAIAKRCRTHRRSA